MGDALVTRHDVGPGDTILKSHGLGPDPAGDEKVKSTPGIVSFPEAANNRTAQSTTVHGIR
jgi:hypothetical protein